MVLYFFPTSLLEVRLIFILLVDNVKITSEFFLCSFSSYVPSISSDNSEYNLLLFQFSIYLGCPHFFCDPICYNLLSFALISFLKL
jgi:hypothetical protein